MGRPMGAGCAPAVGGVGWCGERAPRVQQDRTYKLKGVLLEITNTAFCLASIGTKRQGLGPNDAKFCVGRRGRTSFGSSMAKRWPSRRGIGKTNQAVVWVWLGGRLPHALFRGTLMGTSTATSTQSPPRDVEQHVHVSKGGTPCRVAREFGLSEAQASSLFLSVG